MDFFPNEFPTKARARVEAEKILAYRNLDQRGKKTSSGIAVERLVRDCILRIFLAFAEELCAFGQENGWSVDRIDSHAGEFLRRLTIEVQYDKGHDYMRMISHINGALTQDAERQFRQSPEWKKYENLLLAVAAEQIRQPQSKGRPRAGDPPANQRALIDAFILNLMHAGQRITRKDIWTVAGYGNATEFERFQRSDARTTQSARENFTRAFKMRPEEFIQSLKALNKK